MHTEGIENSIHTLANSITPSNVLAGHDAVGGTVCSLTEAVMGITGGLCRIAEAINNFADIIDKHGDNGETAITMHHLVEAVWHLAEKQGNE